MNKNIKKGLWRVFSVVLWAWIFTLRQVTMRWCWPLTSKLWFLSPKRRKDCGLSKRRFSGAGNGPNLAPMCTANSSHPSVTPSLPPVSFPYSLLNASLPSWCGPKRSQPLGPMGHWGSASWASTSRPSTTLQTNRAMGHKPRATWNLSLPAVQCWYTPQKPKAGKWLQHAMHLTLTNVSVIVAIWNTDTMVQIRVNTCVVSINALKMI